MEDRRPGIPCLAQPEDLPFVADFYERVGYGPGLEQSDRVLFVRDGSEVVAAVRLNVEEGTMVLRGMYVAEDRRGRGLGTGLLAGVSAEVGPVECWCVPFTHLTDFYSRIGFEVREGTAVPAFLRERWKKYTVAGMDVVIMCRPARGRNS